MTNAEKKQLRALSEALVHAIPALWVAPDGRLHWHRKQGTEFKLEPADEDAPPPLKPGSIQRASLVEYSNGNGALEPLATSDLLLLLNTARATAEKLHECIHGVPLTRRGKKGEAP